ncbi:unnamed protein product [Arctia plantaginis]|uniref:Uncharacterized protein n=1 Tax=Arctia plantaginis TaxID=874455 RepID=A0A8S0YLL5_ARCPL|nr:unnamed protein product [Arctia plantaginis]
MFRLYRRLGECDLRYLYGGVRRRPEEGGVKCVPSVPRQRATPTGSARGGSFRDLKHERPRDDRSPTQLL